jgi:hypothetical protein
VVPGLLQTEEYARAIRGEYLSGPLLRRTLEQLATACSGMPAGG